LRLKINADLQYWIPARADILLVIEAAQLPDQVLIEDRLVVDGCGPLTPIDGEEGIGRRTWMEAEGALHARYSAIVDVERKAPVIDRLPITPLPELPAQVVPYLWASRYCEADRFDAFVEREFTSEATGAKLLEMADWINAAIEYCPGASGGRTTAADTFVSRQGVCRDFAHLFATLARASGVPARLVAAYAWGIKPPDFHAVVEVWLDGAWHLIDATRLAPVEGLVRIAVGRDATDIAFMTIFGTGEMRAQSVQVETIES
jgi:transglutaminase-like putative cysteine protease